MTAADHANTIREALKWTPDGYDQVDLDHEGPLRREALAALAALQAQAETAADADKNTAYFIERDDALLADLKQAEAERDRFDDEAERKGLLAAEWKAQHDEIKAERDRLRELAKRAKSQAAAPDYDEEAIRDLLWALVDAALAGEDT